MLELKELKDLHDKAYTYNQITRERASDDMVFYHVTNWDDSLLGDSQLQYRGEFNILRKAGRQISADLRANPVQVDFEPKAESRQDGADFSVKAALSGGAEVLGAMGAFNKKALRISKAFAAAEAFVSAYQGAAAALKKGALGFPEAAAVIAKGIGFVAAIKSVNENGGGTAGGGGGRGSGGGGGVSPSAGRVVNVDLSIVGDAMPSQGQFIQMIEGINDAIGAGATLNVSGA